jgi:hypothetical protein
MDLLQRWALFKPRIGTATRAPLQNAIGYFVSHGMALTLPDEVSDDTVHVDQEDTNALNSCAFVCTNDAL